MPEPLNVAWLVGVLLLIGVWVAPAAAVNATLTWQDNADTETGYAIERRAADGPFGEVASIGADATTYVDGPLSDGTAYCWRVRAFNATAVSDYSNEACLTTPLPPGSGLVALCADDPSAPPAPATGDAIGRMIASTKGGIYSIETAGYACERRTGATAQLRIVTSTGALVAGPIPFPNPATGATFRLRCEVTAEHVTLSVDGTARLGAARPAGGETVR